MRRNIAPHSIDAIPQKNEVTFHGMPRFENSGASDNGRLLIRRIMTN
jgi:hypothetical protein